MLMHEKTCVIPIIKNSIWCVNVGMYFYILIVWMQPAAVLEADQVSKLGDIFKIAVYYT